MQDLAEPAAAAPPADVAAAEALRAELDAVRGQLTKVEEQRDVFASELEAVRALFIDASVRSKERALWAPRPRCFALWLTCRNVCTSTQRSSEERQLLLEAHVRARTQFDRVRALHTHADACSRARTQQQAEQAAKEGAQALQAKLQATERQQALLRDDLAAVRHTHAALAESGEYDQRGVCPHITLHAADTRPGRCCS